MNDDNHNANPTPAKVNWPPPTTPPIPPVTLQHSHLALEHATPEQRRLIGRVDLEFARKVCLDAAEAYAEILRILYADGGSERSRNANDL